MNEIEQKIAELEAEANAKRAYDEVGYLQKMNEANALRDELKQQAVQAAVIAEVQDPESAFVISVGGFTVDFREYARDEESYQALAIATRLKLQEQEAANQAEQNALKESYEAEKSTATAKYDALVDELHQLRIERDDMQSKWQAAATERDNLALEAQAQSTEITSLKRQVEELRDKINKPAQVATNLDSNALADAIKKANDAKPAVYNLREHNGHYLANLAETDEEININWINKGKYRVLSDEEAARFRENREKAKQELVESVPEVAATSEPVEPPHTIAFREEEPTVQEHVLHGTVASKGTGEDVQVTRTEFEALSKRVLQLEVKLQGNAA